MKEVVSSGATVLFVSHNLKTVAEFCDRCLLLDRGRAVMTGPAQEVISAYLNRSQSAHTADIRLTPVTISKVRVRNEHGDCARFQSGEKAWIDIEVTARTRCNKLSIALYITNDNFEEIFHTATERLGLNSFSLDKGEVFACTFELRLNMVTGIFHPSVLVHRNDTQTKYDRWAPAATIYISSAQDAGGTVHCFPKVIRQQILPASDANLATMARDTSGN